MRPLGKTGLLVSELSLGTWGLAGDGYGKVEQADCERTLRRAIDMGFNLIDTADAYGGGRMEQLIGKLFANHPDLVVITKGGVDRTTDPARKNFTRDYLVAAAERSCKRLGIATIPVYLLHHPTPNTIAIGDAVRAMEDLKKAGTIAHWGVCAGDEDVARAAIDQGAEVIELAYNLLHPIDMHRLSGDIMVAGCGVLARSVLAYGMLAGAWSKDHEFPEGDHRADRWTKLELEHRIAQLDAIRYLVHGNVHTMRGAAVRFVLANHLVSSAVLGSRRVVQLEQLVRETGSGPRYLSDDDLRALPRALDTVGIAS
ncbi:MAG: aldo/keto reductase [Polyangiaceae bacterium]|nr:aldo/keto reductase [Polyangiaceae bacterium]